MSHGRLKLTGCVPPISHGRLELTDCVPKQFRFMSHNSDLLTTGNAI